jgi:hypothetical protein
MTPAPHGPVFGNVTRAREYLIRCQLARISTTVPLVRRDAAVPVSSTSRLDLLLTVGRRLAEFPPQANREEHWHGHNN